METIWTVIMGLLGAIAGAALVYASWRGRIVYKQHNALWQWANAMEQWKAGLQAQEVAKNSRPVELHPIKKG